MTSENTSLDQLIEREPLGRLQYALIAMVSAAIIVDGFDIQVIAFVGPVLLTEWGLTRPELGPVISAALIGMAIGALLGGRLGDRWGRRRTLILSTTFFGTLTLLTAFASNVTELTLMRLVTGMGFGAVLPNATALVAEWMPSRLRSHTISLMIIGVPVGGMLGAAVASTLISNYGWQACFVAGGLLGLMVAAVAFFALPESLRFLVQRAPDSKVIAGLLNRAFGAGRFSDSGTFTVSEEVGRAGWSEIFSFQHRRVTLGLALAFVTNLLVFYGLANWLPTLLTSVGVGLDAAIRAVFYLNLWGLPGAVAGAVLVSRAGSRPGLLIIIFGAIAASVALGVLVHEGKVEGLPMIVALSATGTCIGGLQAALYALAASAYPTSCRSTGIGFASGVGRLGPILSGFGGALVLALPDGQYMFFSGVVAALLLTVVGVLIVDRQTPPARVQTSVARRTT